MANRRFIVFRLDGIKAIPVIPFHFADPQPHPKPERMDANTARFWAEQCTEYSIRLGKRIKYEARPILDKRWRSREKRRLKKTYTPVLWHKAKWAQTHPEHFAHVSTVNPLNIAFTADRDHGEQDRQTTMPVLEYLNTFFSKVIKPRTIARWVSRHKRQFGPKLELAHTPKEIIEIYRHSPTSCMTGCRRVGAYGGPDLALAYVKRNGKVVARSVVWPDKKRHTRIYGNATLMAELLHANGYKRKTFKGARLNNKYGVPSLDCCRDYAHKGDYIVLR